MNAALLIQLALGLLDRATSINALILQAQKEGRDVTPDELNQLIVADTAARKDLEDAIAKAQASSMG